MYKLTGNQHLNIMFLLTFLISQAIDYLNLQLDQQVCQDLALHIQKLIQQGEGSLQEQIIFTISVAL